MNPRKNNVQSVIFNRKIWNTNSAREWLKNNGFIRKKRVDITPNYFRYRMQNPLFDHYAMKDLGNGIKLVIGFRN